jgi:hypothetical protein
MRNDVVVCFVLFSSASSWLEAGGCFGGLLCSPEAGALAIRTLLQGLGIQMPENLFMLEDLRFATRHLLRPTVHVGVHDHVQDRIHAGRVYGGVGFGLAAKQHEHSAVFTLSILLYKFVCDDNLA